MWVHIEAPKGKLSDIQSTALAMDRAHKICRGMLPESKNLEINKGTVFIV
jgi:hypothetical protein